MAPVTVFRISCALFLSAFHGFLVSKMVEIETERFLIADLTIHDFTALAANQCSVVNSGQSFLIEGAGAA
jgi:hypothetical protein